MKKFLIFIIIVIFSTTFFYLIKNNIKNHDSLNKIIINSGDYYFPNGITVKTGEVLIIKPGARLKMGENTRIIIDGRIIAKGLEEQKIVFEASEDYWRGIKIDGTEDVPSSDDFWDWLTKGDKKKNEEFFKEIKKGNILKNCIFKNVSTESREFAIGNKWKSTVEAYNTSLEVSKSTFEDILHIGGVLTQRSYVVINENNFTAEDMHKDINCTDNSVVVVQGNKLIQNREKNQRCADGIWINNSTALVSNNFLSGIGDDGIDTDNSKIVILNNEVNAVLDDGIDVDKGGEAFIIGNTVRSSKENGILISEQSKAILVDNSISGSESGIALRDGSGVAGSDLKINNNKKGIFIFRSFPCSLTKNNFLKIKNEILKMTDNEVEALKINGILSASDMIIILEGSYKQGGENYYFIKEDFQKRVQEIFKVMGFSNSEMDFREVEKSGFCYELKNSLYLTSSSFKENEKELSVFDNYQLKMEDIIFDRKEKRSEMEKMFTDNFSCELVDSLNIASVISSSKIIIKEIEKL
jgi:parallel beta-helix repeat protein